MPDTPFTLNPHGLILEIILSKGKANVISAVDSRELNRMWEAFRDNPQQRFAILTGKGEKFFSCMIACLCQAMSLDQDEETIYADFNAEAYNDLIEDQFSNVVKLMSGLGMDETIQEKVLKELSINLVALMVVEN